MLNEVKDQNGEKDAFFVFDAGNLFSSDEKDQPFYAHLTLHALKDAGYDAVFLTKSDLDLIRSEKDNADTVTWPNFFPMKRSAYYDFVGPQENKNVSFCKLSTESGFTIAVSAVEIPDGSVGNEVTFDSVKKRISRFIKTVHEGGDGDVNGLFVLTRNVPTNWENRILSFFPEIDWVFSFGKKTNEKFESEAATENHRCGAYSSGNDLFVFNFSFEQRSGRFQLEEKQKLFAGSSILQDEKIRRFLQFERFQRKKDRKQIERRKRYEKMHERLRQRLKLSPEKAIEDLSAH